MTAARQLARAAKALTAGGVALAGGMATATADGHLTQPEIWVTAAAVLVAVGAVYRVPNTTKTAEIEETSP